MRTIPFLLALMAAVGMQSGIVSHADEKKLGGRAWWSTQDFGPAPFDVPPKEWDGPDMEEGPCPIGFACMDNKVPVHHRTCTDKSRFLLMSEDNRWHCLALGAKP